MKEAGGRECGESRVENRGSCRSNEIEIRYESDCGRDEVYPATFGHEERTGLKLDIMMMTKSKNKNIVFDQKRKYVIAWLINTTCQQYCNNFAAQSSP